MTDIINDAKSEDLVYARTVRLRDPGTSEIKDAFIKAGDIAALGGGGGATGPTGPTGATGAAGASGAIGPTGASGGGPPSLLISYSSASSFIGGLEAHGNARGDESIPLQTYAQFTRRMTPAQITRRTEAYGGDAVSWIGGGGDARHPSNPVKAGDGVVLGGNGIGPSATGGNAVLTPGDGQSGGVQGCIVLNRVGTVDPHVSNGLWISDGVFVLSAG